MDAFLISTVWRPAGGKVRSEMSLVTLTRRLRISLSWFSWTGSILYAGRRQKEAHQHEDHQEQLSSNVPEAIVLLSKLGGFFRWPELNARLAVIGKMQEDAFSGGGSVRVTIKALLRAYTAYGTKKMELERSAQKMPAPGFSEWRWKVGVFTGEKLAGGEPGMKRAHLVL